jgi:hypothetical protein
VLAPRAATPAAALPSSAMNSRRHISALQRFVGNPIAIRSALELVADGGSLPFCDLAPGG